MYVRAYILIVRHWDTLKRLLIHEGYQGLVFLSIQALGLRAHFGDS